MVTDIPLSNPNFFHGLYHKYSIEKKNIQILEKAESIARKNMPKNDLHGIGHIERVLVNANKILAHESADPFIVFLSCWLHDIGRPLEKELKKNHAIISGDIFKQIITDGELVVNNEIRLSVLNCIESHSFSSGRTQDSIEAKILSDADKLDAIGAIGVYRTSCYQHDGGTGIDGVITHFNEKLLHLEAKMHTKTGKMIASQRTRFLEMFSAQLNEELLLKED